MALSFIDYYKGDSDSFSQAVEDTADYLGVNPNWLMAVMLKESRLNPSIQSGNPKQWSTTAATGLIQFTPSAASELGTTTAALAQMDGASQMAYVTNYFQTWFNETGSVPKNLGRLYMYVAAPAYATSPSWAIVYKRGSDAAVLNPSWQDSDGNVRVSSIMNSIWDIIPASEYPAMMPSAVAFGAVILGIALFG